MKKLLGILVLGLLWCNSNTVARAGTTDGTKAYFCGRGYSGSYGVDHLPNIRSKPCKEILKGGISISPEQYVKEIIDYYGEYGEKAKNAAIQSLYDDFEKYNLDSNIVRKIVKVEPTQTQQVAEKTKFDNEEYIKWKAQSGKEKFAYKVIHTDTNKIFEGRVRGTTSRSTYLMAKEQAFLRCENSNEGKINLNGCVAYDKTQIAKKEPTQTQQVAKKEPKKEPKKEVVEVAKKPEEKKLDTESSLPECEGSPFMVQTAGDWIKILTGKVLKNWTNCHGVIDGKKLGKFSGEFKKGKGHGQGTRIWPDGEKYVGEWKDGKRNGQGTYTWTSGEKYVGEWKDGKMHGQGTSTGPDGSKYVGEFYKGNFHGQGTRIWSDGRKYVGEWKDDKQHGQGTGTWASGEFAGEKYVGEWKDGNQHGQGTYTFASGNKYVGEWKDGKQHGQGTSTRANGDKHVGEYKDGNFHGQGTLTWADGAVVKGIFKKGELVKELK